MPNTGLANMRAYHERRCQQERYAVSQACSEQAASAHTRLLDLHRLMLFDLMQKQSSPDLPAATLDSGTLQPSTSGYG